MEPQDQTEQPMQAFQQPAEQPASPIPQTPLPQEPDISPQVGPEQPKGRNRTMLIVLLLIFILLAAFAAYLLLGGANKPSPSTTIYPTTTPQSLLPAQTDEEKEVQAVKVGDEDSSDLQDAQADLNQL